MSIRSIDIRDLPVVLRAQAASSHELDAMDPYQIAEGLREGLLEGILLDEPDRFMLVCWQRDGKSAMLTCFYREGTSASFIADYRNVLNRLEEILRGSGVQHLYLALSLHNPSMPRLHKLFTRMGFTIDLLRLGKAI